MWRMGKQIMTSYNGILLSKKEKKVLIWITIQMNYAYMRVCKYAYMQICIADASW